MVKIADFEILVSYPLILVCLNFEKDSLLIDAKGFLRTKYVCLERERGRERDAKSEMFIYQKRERERDRGIQNPFLSLVLIKHCLSVPECKCAN